MKIQMSAALAAVLACAPLASLELCAQETASSGAAAEKAKPKKKVQKKAFYVKSEEALAVAQAAEQPVIAFILKKGQEKSDLLKKKIINRKEFKDDFAKKNLVVLVLTGLPSKDKTKPNQVDMASFKQDQEFVEKNLAKSGEKLEEPGLDRNYPAIAVIAPDGKPLGHVPDYAPEAGFGAWLSFGRDLLAAGGGEGPEISKEVKKLIDELKPDAVKKEKGKKK